MRRTVYFVLLILSLSAPLYAGAPTEPHIRVTVVKDDNLITICRKYLENPGEWPRVAKANRLKNPHLIHPKQSLVIPAILLRGIPIDGVVTFLKGDVTIQARKEETWFTPKVGDLVRQGASLRTGDDGAVEITFEDGASFLLRANTTLKITSAQEKDVFYLIRELFMPVGRSVTRVKKSTGRESRFEIHTPSAVTAARGTQFRVSVDEAAATRTEVLAGTVGVTAMDREVRLAVGEGTVVKKGMIPKAPRKLVPPPSIKDVKPLYRETPVEFTFGSVDGAASYRAMLSRDREGKDVVTETLVAPDGVMRVVSLEDGEYFLQTRSVDSDGLEGPPSKGSRFEIRVHPLPPFVQRPENGQTFREKSVSLQWLNVRDAASYQYQISRDAGFENLLEDRDGITGVSGKVRMPDYARYFFRVRSIAGDNYRGVWSDTMEFTILPPPDSPAVDAPAVDDTHIRIRWRDLGEGITYHFQMATDPSFDIVLLDERTDKPNATLEKPSENGRYYVRISAIDAQGYEGAFSPPQSFEIKKFPYLELSAILSSALIIVVLIP